MVAVVKAAGGLELALSAGNYSGSALPIEVKSRNTRYFINRCGLCGNPVAKISSLTHENNKHKTNTENINRWRQTLVADPLRMAIRNGHSGRGVNKIYRLRRWYGR